MSICPGIGCGSGCRRAGLAINANVVFGTGQVGSHVITQLPTAGHEVTAAGRTGNQQFAGATNVTTDATDPQFTMAVRGGVNAVYFCLDAPDKRKRSGRA